MILKIFFSIMLSVQDRLYALAESQAGYFTSAQARAVGVSNQELHYLRGRGSVMQVAHGIQRLVRFPVSRHEDVLVAVLWAGPGAVASRETALAVYGIGGIVPQRIHVTLPGPFRGVRYGVEVHRAPLVADEITVREGVPVTTPTRAIADVATTQPHLAEIALRDALESGLVRRGTIISATERYPVIAALLERVG